MANQWYPKGLQHFAQGDIAFLTATIGVILVGTSYVFSSSHEFVTDLGANIVARSSALGTKTTTNGVLNAASPVVSAVGGVVNVGFVVLYHNSGSDATSELLVYWDTGTGIPLTPNGGDVTVNFDTGPNKIAAL
ncbi:MAG: hypothetical protein ACREMY_15555 [bacterium]